MSWDGILSQMLTSKGNCTEGAVYGRNGAVWAKSANFSLNPEGIIQSMFSDAGREYLQTNGLYISNSRFRFVRGDDEVIIMAASKPEDENLPHGAFFIATNQTVVCAVFPARTFKGAASLDAHALADYLKTSGY
ncbi:profilin [Kipferlia bialata]|uniref:Profilin n=1 Tax=Kipferlia bialata TaxID=797122 RepID=A0A391NLK9_9EUKA|nr:profilin [Kipferlia bialata]GCA62791.1 profilin [Kipferlia bialata]|eukprot:g4566.t1